MYICIYIYIYMSRRIELAQWSRRRRRGCTFTQAACFSLPDTVDSLLGKSQREDNCIKQALESNFSEAIPIA